MSVTLKTITSGGERVEICVDRDGTFTARAGTVWLKAPTLHELRGLIARATKRIKVPVAVPVSVLGRHLDKPKRGRHSWVCGHDVQHVTLTGIHGKYGNALYRDDALPHVHGDVSDLRSAYSGHHDIVRRLTGEECAEFTRLSKAKEAAGEALHAFVEPRVVNPEELVKAAIAEKVDTPHEPPETSEDPR